MKKIIALLLVITTTVAVSIGATLAYLTDRDSEANVFTVGDVSIDLNEDFNQGSTLIPGVDIKKEPTITNTGKNAAYVWAEIAVPAALDNEDASKNVIHFNMSKESIAEGLWNWTPAGEYLVKTVEIEGVLYNVYTVLYDTALQPGETTVEPVIYKVYMDDHVDIDPDGNWHHVLGGEVTDIDWSSEDGNPVIYVSAYAIQTEGFKTAYDAYQAYIKQWTTAEGVNNGVEYGTPSTITEVSTAAELTEALAEGGIVVLTADVKLDDAPIVITADTTLNLNGNTLVGQSTSNTTSNLIKVQQGATLTISNGTVSFAATTPDTNWGGEGQPAFPGYANNTISNSGKLIIDGATIENKTAPGGASYAIDNYPGADLIINSGVIDGQGKTAIRMFCNSTTVSTNVTINGGTVTGSRAIWIQLPGSNAEQKPPVNLTINGGVLESTLDPTSENYMAIYGYSYGQNASGVNVTITGGTFNGNVAFGGGSKNGAENVTITGGTFNGTLGRYTNDGWQEIAKP